MVTYRAAVYLTVPIPRSRRDMGHGVTAWDGELVVRGQALTPGQAIEMAGMLVDERGVPIDVDYTDPEAVEFHISLGTKSQLEHWLQDGSVVREE